MIRVQVTQNHINDSPKNDNVNGLLCNAIADSCHGVVSIYIEDNQATLYIYDAAQDDYIESQKAELPVIAQLNQDQFNAGLPVEPFAFYIDFYIAL